MNKSEYERKIAEREYKVALGMDMAKVKKWRAEKREVAAIAEYRAHVEAEQVAKASQNIQSTCKPTIKTPQWAEILGVQYPCTLEVARQAFLSLAKKLHPDQGGTSEGFIRLNKAWDEAQVEFRSHT